MSTYSSTLALKIPWTEELGASYYPWGCKEQGLTELLRFTFPGWISISTSFVSLFIFYIFSYLLSKTMGCFSGCLMSSAGIQKLFCGIYSAFKYSFDEFVGEKVVSLSSSSAILGPSKHMFSFFLQSYSSVLVVFKCINSNEANLQKRRKKITIRFIYGYSTIDKSLNKCVYINICIYVVKKFYFIDDEFVTYF